VLEGRGAADVTCGRKPTGPTAIKEEACALKDQPRAAGGGRAPGDALAVILPTRASRR